MTHDLILAVLFLVPVIGSVWFVSDILIGFDDED